MHRFLAPIPFKPGAEIELDPTQSRHLAKVLRVEQGEVVALINGLGEVALADVMTVHSKHACVRVTSVERDPFRSAIRLCFGIPKGQALDVTVRRTTELGIEGFQPLQTRYSVPVKGWKADRWATVVAEVAKQCEVLVFPQIHEPQTLEQWLRSRPAGRALVLCYEESRFDKSELDSGTPVDLLIGPEGGFHPDEVEALKKAGAALLGLGRNRLRAETAAIVATTLVKKQMGEI